MADPKTLQLVCPTCGTHGAPDLFATDPDNKSVMALLAGMPAPVGTAMIRYLRMCAPRQRKLTAPRARRLIEELAPMVRDQRASRDGRVFPAPHAAWVAAIDDLVGRADKLRLPLETNGYLLELLADHGDRVSAVTEQQAEAERQQASQQRRSAPELIPGQRPDESKADFYDRINREAEIKRQAAQALRTTGGRT